MYKVCFVDDEPMIHKVLANLVDWFANGFEVAGTATDGKEALQLYQRVLPDLMFIDIKMPIMDGLECVRRIREQSSSVKLVLLTAFEEFEYAHHAIELGVNGYLLKPVKRAEVNKLVEKTAHELAIAQERENSLSNMRRESFSSGLSSTFQQAVTLNRHGKLEPFSLDLDILFLRPLGIIEIYLYHANKKLIYDHTAISMYLQEFSIYLGRLRLEPLCEYRPDLAHCFLFIPEAEPVHIENIRYFAQAKSGEGTIADIYVTGEALSRQTLKGVLDALEKTPDQNFYGEDCCVQSLAELSTYNPPQESAQYTAVITSALEQMEPDLLKEHLHDILKHAGAKSIEPRAVKGICFDFLAQLKISMRQFCPFDTFHILRDIPIADVLNIRKGEALLAYMEHCITECFAQIRESARSLPKNSLIVMQANIYADQHFHEAAFSVHQVADYVGLSKNYFIKIYKEVSGLGFWEYITNLRIDRAKAMLKNTDRSIAQIGNSIGYESEYHFSRKFKQLTGKTPNQFRKE